MRIKEVTLKGFRNLEESNIIPSGGMNVFHGENAQGKTNFLEALYFCSTGRSMRTKNDQQLIAFNDDESHIRLFVDKKNRAERIDVHLKRNMKKGIAVNGVPIRRLGDLFGTLYTVIFSPEDLSLVKDGPGVRRRFMDMELCQLSNVYYYDLQQYYRVLKQRNNLLREIQKKPSLEKSIFVWDEQLTEYGERIMSARDSFIKRLNKIAAKSLHDLTGGADDLKIIYRPNCEIGVLSEKTAKGIQRDIFMGSTTHGPHKDDIIFMVNDKDVKSFGSQGQQRTTALAARLAEVTLIIEETGEEPVLLLDDVLSELDEGRQRFLMESIDGLQVFLTCTGIEDSIKKYINKDNLFLVKAGSIK